MAAARAPTAAPNRPRSPTALPIPASNSAQFGGALVRAATNQQLRRGVHKTVQTLEKDIHTWAKSWNDNPRPYTWTKAADQILERLATFGVKA